MMGLPMPTLPFADDPILTEGAAYWLRKRAGRPMPARRDIDLLDMPARIVPHVVLAEILAPSGLVRYRIVGEEMVERFGFNFGGKTSRQIFHGTYRTFLEDTFALLYRDRMPVYTESQFRWDNDGHALTRRLMMPLANDGDSPSHVFIVQTWPPCSKDSFPARRMVIQPEQLEKHSSKVFILPQRWDSTGAGGRDS